MMRLLHLANYALERGDYDAARRSWEQMSPLLRDPKGRSAWHTLRGINLDTNWADEGGWNDRQEPPNWLAFPDTDYDLATIRAWLIVASIRAGELERAAVELAVFRRLHPNASGTIGGQEGLYVAALEKLLASAREWQAAPAQRDWPTFAGSQTRSAVAAPCGAVLVPLWEQAIACRHRRLIAE